VFSQLASVSKNCPPGKEYRITLKEKRCGRPFHTFLCRRLCRVRKRYAGAALERARLEHPQDLRECTGIGVCWIWEQYRLYTVRHGCSTSCRSA
jgi:hypothetical protein